MSQQHTEEENRMQSLTTHLDSWQQDVDGKEQQQLQLVAPPAPRHMHVGVQDLVRFHPWVDHARAASAGVANHPGLWRQACAMR